uniref:Uncharacterized protein n=1 Tax=Glossina palpalis gambiensis TaxID=67801 RepID=A0A1B0AKF3_9MUSC
MTMIVSKVNAANEFSYKTMKDGHVKILMKSIDSSGELRHHPNSWHRPVQTYSGKQVKCLKCGLDRITESFTKNDDTLPKCVNCPKRYKKTSIWLINNTQFKTILIQQMLIVRCISLATNIVKILKH